MDRLERFPAAVAEQLGRLGVLPDSTRSVFAGFSLAN
jgi:hypothetical protein